MKKISLLSFAAAVAVSGSALASDFAGYIGGGYSFVPVISGAKGKVTAADTLKTSIGALNEVQNFSIASTDYKNVTMDKKGNAIAGFVGFGYYVAPEVLVGIEGNYDQMNNARYLTAGDLKFTSGNGPLVKFSRMGASLVVNGTVFSNEYVGLAVKVGAGYQRVAISQTFSDAAINVLAGNDGANASAEDIKTNIGSAAFVSNTISTNTFAATVGDNSNSTNVSTSLDGKATYSTLYGAFQGVKKANTFGALAGVEIFFPVMQDSLDVFVAGTYSYTKPVQTIGDKLDMTLTLSNLAIASTAVTASPAGATTVVVGAAAVGSVLSGKTATFAAVSPAHQLLVSAGLRAKF